MWVSVAIKKRVGAAGTKFRVRGIIKRKLTRLPAAHVPMTRAPQDFSRIEFLSLACKKRKLYKMTIFFPTILESSTGTTHQQIITARLATQHFVKSPIDSRPLQCVLFGGGLPVCNSFCMTASISELILA